jgi:hypothetical protein
VPGFQASNFQIQPFSGRGFEADWLIAADDFNDPVARVDLAAELVAPATHVLIEDMMPLVGLDQLRAPRLDPEFGRRECERLLASGRKVACLIHGSAARAPALHRGLYPWSPFHDRDSDLHAARVRDADKTLAALADLDVPVFVATLDMLEYVPNADWLPIVIGRDDFAPAPPWCAGPKLKVAHAPTSAALKGSEFVDAALRRLDRAGLIDYRSVRGVPPVAMPRLLRQVDVVVDQVVLGNPATLLNQTMAAGRLGVAHVSPAVRRRYDVAPPVVEADPSNIAQVVADIAADPEAYRRLAESGPAFARRFHDGRLAAEVLTRHFLKPEEGS